ncbi:uncharacterized protein LOC143189077 isoform X10 [Calliopsis andreniformis]|uniref:uncharacterized protein LOC143189077 isoform X10 n=1 Tax=Calliopsis andreniformis TaxID=337506 RepID=UPI003FCED2EB
MGQCVSRKASGVIATGHRESFTYHMDKSSKNGHKGVSKRGGSNTHGTAISFGFRRRPTSGIPMPITNYSTELNLLHPRSKSAGPEQNRRRDDESNNTMYNSSSGRSTPRLVPPKKESSGVAVRMNRFGYRQPQAKFTNKVSDVSSSHTVSHYNQDKLQQQQQQQEITVKQQHRVIQSNNASSTSKVKTNQTSYSNTNAHTESNRRLSGIPEPIGRYTLHTSHLPLPQYAVRMTDANSKIAKTMANQTRKVSATSKSSTSSKDGSSTEDSGVGSQHNYTAENNLRCIEHRDSSLTRRRGIGRPKNFKMVASGKSFDVRDVRDDDSTVTEISVIPLPKTFMTTNTGLVREIATQYQRTVNKDNRHIESATSMSTTSSEGYDEGLGEEKVYKDKSHSEKIPFIKSDFSPPSSDDPEYGHGEAMADEYSLSSNDECQRFASNQHMETISNVVKNGTMPKAVLRSVLLTIEDPAFAAAAASSTTLIDDETSPVDSLFDSLTVSITQSDVKISKKEHVMDQSGNAIDDDSPGTPTNASNSLSLSEGREYFDDEIADQPGLVFDDTSRDGAETQSAMVSQALTENSHTLVESVPKTGTGRGKNTTNSPYHGKKISRAGSVDTLSPCESLASDDLILDYEQSDASSYDEQNRNEYIKGIRTRQNRSVTDLPRSTDNKRSHQFSSPLRTSRNVESPDLESADEGSPRVNYNIYQYMHQDIVCIKAMLLKLKRVLQENDAFYNENEGGIVDVSTSPCSGGNSITDELTDLRREVIFLQGEVEDRNRTIQVLQIQIAKLQGPNGIDCQTCTPLYNHNNILSTNACNAATQTEKMPASLTRQHPSSGPPRAPAPPPATETAEDQGAPAPPYTSHRRHSNKSRK